jgi:hypothetical protein
MTGEFMCPLFLTRFLLQCPQYFLTLLFLIKNYYDSNWGKGGLPPYYKAQLIPFIRVTIYNGDVDACVPFVGNEMWTAGLKLPVVTPWRPWSVDKQVVSQTP